MDGGKPDAPDTDQSALDALFDSNARYWRDVYASDDFQGRVYRRRHERALAWVDTLDHKPRSAALEVGCGAGLLAMALAERDYSVVATDTSQVMVEQARRAVHDRNLDSKIDVRVADTHGLPWPDETFMLVVALGVVPWLHSPATGIAEMARVTRHGGHVILSADNSLGLSNLLEPRLSIVLAPVRRAIAGILRALGLRAPRGLGERRYSPHRVDRMIEAAGLVREGAAGVGFGRFTFFGRRVLPERRSLALDDRLQGLADRSRPIIRRLGNHYLVLATKR